MDDFTRILSDASLGDKSASDDMLPLVYNELRRLAYSLMQNQSSMHTLQATALVHEAWLKMVNTEGRTWKNRSHFMATAAMAMRNVLIDHARTKTRKKRGGKLYRVELDHFDLAIPEVDDFVMVIEEALNQLEIINAKWARVVVMKFYGGMTIKEVATVMDISESSVERYWTGARTWLIHHITSDQ